MKRKIYSIALIVLVLGVILGASGVLGDYLGSIIGLCSLTVLILGAAIYSAMNAGFKGKKKIFNIIMLCISCCALFWWAVGSLVWPDNLALRAVSFCIALPCLLAMPASKTISLGEGVFFRIKLPGLPFPIIVIIIIGLVLGGVLIGFKSCAKKTEEKEYLSTLENVEVEVYDKYFNNSTGKFDFAIRLKNGTTYTVTDMRFKMKVYDKTGALLVDTAFYIPEGSAFSQGEERCFYIYVKQSDVESVETLYNADLDSLEIQLWITEVEYEEYDFPLNANYQCFTQTANP